MHDPMVLLWSVTGWPLSPRSFRAWRRHGRFPTWLDIWHVEPNGKDSGTVCDRSRWAWHVHNWSVRFIPWRDFRYRFVRCAECGRRMNTAARFSYMSTDKVWHDECQTLGHLRSERLVLLETMTRLLGHAGITDRDELEAAIVDPTSELDQFTLWYRTWSQLGWYWKKEPKDRWRSPNAAWVEQKLQPAADDGE